MSKIGGALCTTGLNDSAKGACTSYVTLLVRSRTSPNNESGYEEPPSSASHEDDQDERRTVIQMHDELFFGKSLQT